MRRILLALIAVLAASAAEAQPYWGNFPDGGTLYFYTNTVGSDGVADTPTSEAIAVYKDGGDTELTTGASIDDDVDSKVGFHRITIDTTQSGFDAGSLYTVMYTAGTVDSVSIAGRKIGSFYLGPKDANVTHNAGTAITATSGVQAVNATQISGDSNAADNLELAFDGTGYSAALSVRNGNAGQLIYVDDTDGAGDLGTKEAPLDTIAAALAVAGDFDTVELLPGAYTLASDTTVTQSGLTIRGASSASVTITTPGGALSTMMNLGTGTRIENVTIDFDAAGGTAFAVSDGGAAFFHDVILTGEPDRAVEAGETDLSFDHCRLDAASYCVSATNCWNIYATTSTFFGGDVCLYLDANDGGDGLTRPLATFDRCNILPDNTGNSSGVAQYGAWVLDRQRAIFNGCNFRLHYNVSGSAEAAAVYASGTVDEGGPSFVHINGGSVLVERSAGTGNSRDFKTSGDNTTVEGRITHFGVTRSGTTEGNYVKLAVANPDTGGIVSGSFASGAIDAAAIAADAFGASEAATTLIDEIQANLAANGVKLTSTGLANVNTEVDTALSDYGALKPTTPGRTLDIDATNEAEVNLTEVMGTALTESAAGRLAGNLSTFWDNGNAATTQTVDDVGSGGGGGSNDWTATERNQIRHRLGIDGTSAEPAATPSLLSLTQFEDKIAEQPNFDDLVSANADISDILADTDELQGDLEDGGRLDVLIDATVADTNELQADWANGGRLDLVLDGRASQTSVDDVPTVSEFNNRTLAAADYFVHGTDTVTVGDIQAAALAKFVTEDTGETEAVDGSVGDLSGGAGGEVSIDWDQLVADHDDVAGSFGERLSRIPNAAPGSGSGLATATNITSGTASVVSALGDLEVTGVADFTADQQAQILAALSVTGDIGVAKGLILDVRRIDGSMKAGTITIDPTESVTVAMKFNGVLAPGDAIDEIVSVTLVEVEGHTQVDSPAFDDVGEADIWMASAVKFSLSGGTTNETDQIKVKVLTVNGDTLTGNGFVKPKGD